jgi:RHS repeat-associated protein
VINVIHPNGVNGTNDAPDHQDSTADWWQYSYAPETDPSSNYSLTVDLKDPTGIDTWNSFDPNGNLIDQVTGPDANDTNDDEPVNEWSYNALGQLTSTMNPNYYGVSYAYDPANGQVSQETAYRDNYTAYTKYFTYDDSPTYYDTPTPVEELLGSKDADGHSLTYTYEPDRIHLATSTTPRTNINDAGETTTYTYTQANTTPAVNDPSTGTYAPAGLLLTETDPAGAVTTYGYDHYGDQTRKTDETGVVETSTYDSFGRVTKKVVSTPQNPTGVETDYTYDAVGNQLTETDPAIRNPLTGVTHQKRITNGYNDNSDLTSVTTSDLTGGDATRTVIYGYDKQDRRFNETDNGVLQYSTVFDSLGREASYTAANGAQYVFTYDDQKGGTAGNLTRKLRSETLQNFVDNPDAPTTPRPVRLAFDTYDLGGRLASTTDANGATTAYTYTNDDLPLSATLTNYNDGNSGTPRSINLETYQYDPAGNITKDTQGAGTSARVTNLNYDDANENIGRIVDPGGLNRATTVDFNNVGQITTTIESQGTQELVDETQYTGPYVTKSMTINDATDNLVTQYTRDAFGNLLTSTDPRGASDWTSNSPGDPTYTTTYTYDGLNRLSTSTTPAAPTQDGVAPDGDLSGTSINGYDTFGDLTQTEDARGNITTYKYDTNGRKTEVDYPAYTTPGGTQVQASEHWTYDTAGNVLTHTAENGQVTSYKYDLRNRKYKQTDPPIQTGAAAGVSTWVYDDNSNVKSTTSATGAQILYWYDSLNQLSAIDRYDRRPTPTDNSTTVERDDFGDIVHEVDGDDNGQVVSNYTYDAAGEMLTSSSSGLGTTHYAYDVDGNVTKVTDPLGRAIATTYDAAERQIGTQELAPNGTVTATTNYTNDLDGNVTSVTDPDGNAWTATYDARGQLDTLTDPAPKSATGASLPAPVTQFGYDLNGNRTEVNDADNHPTYTTYNSWDLPETVIQPATTAHPNASDRSWTTTYNADQQPTTETEPGGVSISLTYDNLGDLTGETGTGSNAVTKARSMTYDADQRLTSIDGGRTTFYYNDRGDIIDTYIDNYDDGAASFTTTYNSTDEPLTSEQPGNYYQEVDYTYLNGELNNATSDQTGDKRHYTYDTAGELTGTTDTNATTGVAVGASTFTYNDAAQLSSQTSTDAAGATIAAQTYAYDPDGNLTNQTTTGTLADPHQQTYTYDADDRLIRTADLTNHTGSDYSWDSAGNRTSVSTWTGSGTPATVTGTTTATYDQRNELLTTSGPTGTTSRSWSAQGTLTGITTTPTAGSPTTETRRYDAFNQLINDSAADSQATFNYIYDSLGRLMVTPDGEVDYYNQNRNPSAVTNGVSNNFEVATTPSGSPLGYKNFDTGAASNLLTDAHGDVIAALDPSTGDVASSTAYDPFGQVLASSGSPARLGYQGGLTDQTSGQVNAQTRWYDPSSGTFTSQDSTPGLPINSGVDANLYAYGSDNPATFNDPTGQCSIWCNLGNALEQTGSDIVHAGASLAHATASALKSTAEAFATAATGFEYIAGGFAAVSGGVLLEISADVSLAAAVGACAASGVCEALLVVGAVVAVAAVGTDVVHHYIVDSNHTVRPIDNEDSQAHANATTVDDAGVKDYQGELGGLFGAPATTQPVARSTSPTSACAVGQNGCGSTKAATPAVPARPADIAPLVHNDPAIVNHSLIDDNTIRVTTEQVKYTTTYTWVLQNNAWVSKAATTRTVTTTYKDEPRVAVHEVALPTATATAATAPIMQAAAAGESGCGKGEAVNSCLGQDAAGNLSHAAAGSAAGAAAATGAQPPEGGQNCDEDDKTAGGGRFGRLKTGDGYERHHMPADSVSPLSKKDGPAIRMTKGDHMQTSSHGNGTDAKAYRALQKELLDGGRFDDAVQMDIDDIQGLFGDKYDDEILQMIDSLGNPPC